ncbi:MAG TPA: hypothetical protein VNO79_12210 [Actinomycetota bacterium]|nr:hypothetical protein [Actinomycetota bacterium]
MSGPAELCPACGAAPQTDERSGFCGACLAERRTEAYNLKRRAEALERRERWRERALEARRAWDAERQAWHRLRERLRPRRPAPRGVDPWRLAFSALEAVEKLRPVAARSDAHEALEAIEEAIRWLAWPLGEPDLADRLQAGEADPAEHGEALDRWASEAEDELGGP